MAKVLKIAAVVVGAVALIATGVGAIAAPALAGAVTVAGISASTLFLVAGGLTVAASLLQKKPTIPSSQTDRLTATIDPRAYRKTVFGQTAMATDVRYEEWSGSNQDYCDWIVALASHAIDGVEEIWLNTDLAWTAAGGVQSKFSGYFTVPNIVLEGTPANAFTFGAGKWNAATARLTGCAYMRLRFKVTGNSKKSDSPFSGGPPSRITIIGRGAKLYDPRRDSTIPGGSGPMRWNDQSTWRYTATDGTVIGENLPLQILYRVLGWRIRNPSTGVMKLAVGSGIPGKRIGFQSFQIAANLADELVNRSAGGQEPRYHGAGVVSEGDDNQTVLDALCAGCCGRFRDTSGKLDLVLAHNDLAEAALDDGLTDDDVIGGFTWDPDPSLGDTPNIVRGQYVDATDNSLYQPLDYPEVSLTSPDGQDRYFSLDLGYVESPSQVQRIAKQVLQRKQYQRKFTAPFDIRAWKYPVGKVVPFTFAPLSFNRQLFRVEAQELGQDGACNMTLSFEANAIYQWDADDVAPVQPATALTYDARNNPLIQAIADVEDEITALASDGIISHGSEKRDVSTRYESLAGTNGALASLNAKYVALGSPSNLTPAHDAANAAITALTTYLGSLSPAWNDVGTDTPVDPNVWKAKWIAAEQGISSFNAAITGQPGSPGINNVNLIRFSNFDQGTRGWNRGGTGVTVTSFQSSTYSGKQILIAEASIQAVAGSNLYIFHDAIPAADGQRFAIQYGAEGYIASGSATITAVRLVAQPHDSTGAVMSNTVIATLTGPQSFGTPIRAFYTAPAGAVSLVTYVQYLFSNATGTAHFSITQPMVSTATADQTEYPAYTAGVADGATGVAGTPAISLSLSKKAIQLWAYADGTVTSFADASGQLRVYSGGVDVTADATLSASASSGLTGTINTATNTPVSGQAKGYYRVTVLSANTGTLTLTAVYNGVTLTETFSVSKLTGGYEIVSSLPSTNLFEGRQVYLTTDDKLYRYTGSAWTSSTAAADITGQITATQITDGSISTPKIAAGAVAAGNIQSNAITSDKINAGAVTAAKIGVTELSAITATIGLLRTATTGARLEIESNQQRVYDSAGTLRLRLGVWT